MAGHSHWAGIKHRKAAVDAKRGKIFSKHTKAILVAVKGSGGDPDMNLALKYAIDRARADNMPKDVIERAIKKGTGEEGTIQYSEILYEGFGPEKVAVVLDILTDNRNRTASELRKIFEKKGGVLGGPGSVAWMFVTRGILEVAAGGIAENDLMEAALEAGAEDVTDLGDGWQVVTSPEAFSAVRKAFAERDIQTRVAEIMRHPTATVAVTDRDAAGRVLRFMNEIEDHDDVLRVSANFDIPPDLIESLDA